MEVLGYLYIFPMLYFDGLYKSSTVRRMGFSLMICSWETYSKWIILRFSYSYWRIKIFHYNGTLHFKKMFDKLYQVSVDHDCSSSVLISA